VEGVVVARVVEANVTALDFRFEQLAHDGFRLVSYGLAAPNGQTQTHKVDQLTH